MRAIDVGFTGHGLELREPHRSPITSVEWSPDGSILATGSYDGTVKLWEPRTGGQDPERDSQQLTVRHTFVHRRLVNGVRWSRSGRLLASSSADHSCRIWDVDRLVCVGVLVRHTDDVNSMAWSPDDSHLATVSEDGTGRFWRIDGEALEDGIMVHEDHCMSVDWSPSQDLLATCGEDAAIRLWNGRGKPLAVWPQEGDLEMCRFSPDGTRLAATCDDGCVRVFDLDGRCQATIGPVGQAVKSVAWSPDGRRLALGAYDATCTVWDVASGRLETRFSGPRLWPRAVHWNPAGTQIAIGTLDDRPAVVDAGRSPAPAAVSSVTLAPEQPTYGINAISPVPAEGVLLAVDDGQLWFWHLRQPDGEAGRV